MNPTRRFALVTLLTWLPTGLYLAPMVLLMLHRGLSVPEIAMVGLAYSITVAALELPTGGLADVLGRRRVLIWASLSSFAGLLLLGFAHTALLFAASGVLRGIARALGTGPAEAWYVDTVHTLHGPAAPLGKGLARGQVALSSGLAIGTISGGVIPLLLAGLVPTPLAVPILIGAGIEVVRLIVIAVGLPEPRHARPSIEEVLRGVPVTVREGLRLSLRDSALARLMVISGVLGAMLGTIELMTPAWLARITGEFETAGIAYAIVAALGFAASAAGGSLSAWVVRATGGAARGGQTALAVVTVALVLLAASTLLTGPGGVAAAALSYCLIFIGLGIGNPALATITHDRVTSGQRATVLSAQSLALMLPGGTVVIALSGLLPAVAFLIVAGMIGISGVLLRSAQMSASLAKLSP